jgi:hypothetical protein
MPVQQRLDPGVAEQAGRAAADEDARARVAPQSPVRGDFAFEVAQQRVEVSASGRTRRSWELKSQ